MTRRILLFVALSLLAYPGILWSGEGEQLANKDSIKYLEKLAVPSGGFLANEPAGGSPSLPTLRATTSAARALHYLGGTVPNLEACKKFVNDCFDPSTGAFKDTPSGKADVFTTAIGVMAVVDFKMPRDRYLPAVKFLVENTKGFDDIRIAAAALESMGMESPRKAEWLQEIRKTQNSDGTFGKGTGQARATGGAVAAILRLGGSVENRDKVLDALKHGQRKSGAFGKEDAGDASDLETTYRVMRSFMMLKSRPTDVKSLQAFIAKCRNQDGGYGVAPGQPSSAAGTYYAAIIRHWLE
jgi:prenyltransferase beta subunit